MEPEQSEQGKRLDPETIARYVNEEHAETMRDLAEVTPQELAYAEATLRLRELAETIGPESIAEQIREMEGRREPEGGIEQGNWRAL